MAMASEWLKQLAAEAAGKTPAAPQKDKQTGVQQQQANTPEERIQFGHQSTSEASQWLQGLAADAVRNSPYYKYAVLSQANDFAEKSKYASTSNGYKASALDIIMGTQYTDESRSGWDDPLYEHINGNKEATGWLSNAAAAGYGDGLAGIFGRVTEDKHEATQMTKDEVATYNYIHATQGKDAAREYYEYIRSDLYARDRKAAEAYWAEEAKKNPVGTSVFSVLTAPMKGMSYVGQLADVMSGKEIDPNDPYNSFVYNNNAVRNQVAKTIEKSGSWGKVGSFAYQTGMSMADFLFTTGISGGNGTVAMLIMGSNTAADVTLSARERGVESNKAFLLGTVAGTVEAVTERFSIETLLNPDLLADGSVKYILKNALAEGSEEATSELANTIADILISQDKSQWQLDIQAYMKQGMTEQEAFARAVADKAADVGLAALGGFFSGSTMAGTGAGINSIIQHSQSSTVGNSTGGQDSVAGQTNTPSSEKLSGSSNGLQQAIQQAQSATQGGDNLQQADSTSTPGDYFDVTAPGVGQTAQIGVKEQIRSQQDILNAMQPVYAIQVPTQFTQMDKAGKQEWVVEKLRSTGYKVDRKGFGIIDFAKKRLKAAFKYFDSGSADEAAFEALPYVLENGIEISSHSDHKGRNYRTVTFAAPVTINGKRGNMAVVVKQTTDNFYKVHRILTPDGSVFQLSETTNEAARADGGVTEIGSLATSNGAASSNSIPDRNQDVNTGSGEVSAEAMRQQAKADYRAGKITDAEFDAIMDEVMHLEELEDGTSVKNFDSLEGIDVQTDNINANVNGGNENVRTDEQGQGTVAADAGAGDRISDGSGQRHDGASAGEQAGGLGSRTGQAAQRQSSAADRKARIDRLNRIRSLQLEKVSSAELGVKRGTEGKNLQLIPEEHWDSEMEELAERIWQETGKTASFVMGVIEIQGSNGRIRKVNGVMTGDRILVRVDHLRLTMEQIADHESYHGRVDYFKQRLNQEIRQHIIDTFSEVEFRKVLNKYFDAYEGVYDFGKAQTGEEFERLMQKLEEEVFADAYAGINSFGAGQFTEAVNERLEQLGTGRYRGQAQENGVRQTAGPPEGQKESTADGGEWYSVEELEREDRKIYPGMDEDQRASILAQKEILSPAYDDSNKVTGPLIIRLKGRYVTEARSLLTDLARKCGDFRSDLHNADVDISFSYSNKSLKESVNKQSKRGGDAETFGKMLTVLPQICEGSVEVEAHTDRYAQTARADSRLKEMHVLLGAFWDGDCFIPVQLEVKEYKPDSGIDNKLYVTVTIKTEAGVTPRGSTASADSVSIRSRPASKITIAELIANVKDETGGLVKYLPDQMLNSDQLAAKQKALAEDTTRLGDMRYEYAVQQGSTEAVDSMLREKATQAGYTASDDWRMSHRAPNRESGVSLDRADEVYGGDGSIYSPAAARYYGEGRDYDGMAIVAINKAHFDPDANITVYRAVPKDVRDTKLRNGDWVTPTREYAEEHGERNFDGDYRIMSESVPAKHLYLDGNSIHEFGYDNGRSTEVYKNTANNVKLNEVTYDDDANLIPISKRFDPENDDERYSLDPEDVDRVDAELESEQRRWKEMWLQDQLGEEGVKEYQARKAEQEARKKADEKQVQQVKQKIDANKRSLKREASESAANARQSRRLALETKPKEAKKELRKAMLDMFSIPAGSRTEAVAVIDSFADRLLRQGSLTEEDRKAFFDRMYAAGMMTVPADDYLKLGRDAIYKGKIFVNESIRQELGDDWNELRRRAFSAGVYLTNNRADPGVDVWNDDLAHVLPGLFDSEETDLRLALERIIQVAEEGRDERVSLAEYTAMLAGEEYISEDQVLDQMERDMDLALRVFAKSAGLEIKLREQAIKEQAALTKENARQRFQQAQERAERKETAQRQQEQKELRELQQKTLKALQWLNRNRYRAPEELRQTWDEVLSDIDIYAVGAANEMNWSNKYGATWKDLAQMYSYARENDPNFMPSKDLEKIVSRLNDKKIEDMDPAALSDLYRMAVGLRTEFYNRNNVAGDEERRLFSEVYTDAKQEIKAAPGKYNGKWADKLFNLDQLTPMNVLQRMAGWNPDSTFFSMAKQLERGERDMRAFSVKAQRMLQDFLTEHENWVKKADGQGKDAIWYEIEVPELMELGMGDKPIFGDTVKVYMTPAQKVHMYLESKNVDNLRHMTGGRTFADKELYSQGKRREAFAQGRTIRMAPETVKQIVSDLTPEEMELAEALDKFYNEFAKGEINRVSNILYGYDKAMGRHYAPIFTNQNYVQSEIGIFDQTAEGVGNLKAREYSKNPSYNIGAFDAFERNVDQTARFVGMAIPARNWNSLLNWREKNDSMGDVITHKWGNEGKNYITDLIATLQGGDDAKTETVSSGLSKLQSNYISAVFGANPGIVLKQLGSIPLAGAYLGNGNMPTPAQIKGIDRNLIAKYTQDLEWRTMGYSTPETKQLKDNPNWTQTNKAFKFAFGGGAITAMDGWAASTLWPWAENKVRREHPDLELGTQDQIDKGESPFYKKVAEEFEYAMSRSQSVSDEIHQSSLRKSGNVLAKAFTMFRSDSAQTYNTLRQKIGEARYYASTGADDKATQAAKKAVGSAVMALLANAAWAEGVSFLMALWKNGAKYYRDDEDELTAEAVVGEMVSNMLASIAGTVTAGDELTGLIGNILTGEKWYGIDAPGLGQLSDLCETIYEAGGGMRDIIEGAVDVLKNGGDVGQYFQDNSSDIRGSILELAEAAATYIPGLPVSNVEAYLMGALKWISPALHTEYEDMLATAKKDGLSGLKGEALTTRVGNILENRRVTKDAETAKTLAGLYEAGYKAAVPSDTPGSVTVDGEQHTLSAYQQQVYNNAWAGIVGDVLDDVVSSEEFLNASEEKQEKMLKTLYGYASDQAKAELFEGAEGSSRAEDIAAFREAGLDMADYLGAVADGLDPDKFLETFGNGLDSDDTEELLNAIEDLEPEEGKVQVTDVQRWRVCVDLYGNPQFQLAALMTYMTDSQFAKAKTAHTFDVDLDAYVKLYEIRAKHDANGNKSYSQAEYKAAIDTLNVSNDDRAVLWQLATGAKSAKNNPYSSAVGQRVLDAMG